MKIFLIVYFICLNGWGAKAEPQINLDLLPLQLQMRYEDANDQTRTNHQYQAYSIAFQYENFRTELEYSQFFDSTGNSSLKIEQAIKEFDLGLGYRIYDLADPVEKLSLSGIVNLWLGQTQTSVDTTLLGVQNSAQSEKEMVIGAGVSLIGRISYFLIETDLKMLNSKNMNPRDVPVFAIKLGIGIPL